MKPDASTRKMELAQNPGKANVVVTSDDDAFLNKALGIEEEGEISSDGKTFIEGVDEGAGEITTEEVSAMEEKLGRKLSEEEISELSAIKKEETGVAEEIPEDFELIQPEKLPKELQPHFKRMFGSFTKKMQGIADKTKKAELFDYFSENPEQARRMLMGDITPPAATKEGAPAVDENAEDSFVKQLNLPEDNELTPAVEALAKLMVKGFGEVRAGREKDSENDLRKGIKTYFDQNQDLLKDKELCITMDRIGMENPGLYRNMPRLRKFAEAELGRPAKAAKEEAKTSLAKLYKSMQEAKRSAVSKPSTSSDTGTKTKTKDIGEAFERALTRVRLKHTKGKE